MRRPAPERREEIVETALRLADEVGPDRLTVGQVAEAVGITQPAVFRHFPRKDDLWLAIAGWIGDRLSRLWRESEQPGLPLDRLQRLIAAQLRLVQATPAVPAILFSRELHSRNDGLRRAFARLMEGFHARLQRLVAEAQEAGALRPDPPAADLAFLVMATVQGVVLRWSVSGRRFDLPAEGGRLLGLLLAGFAPDAKRPE